MTIHDYDIVMKRIGIAELKARLSENLAAVRRGETIEVLDRTTPVALIIPYRPANEPLQIRPAGRKTRLGEIPLPRRSNIREDIVELLLDDRAAR